ncbi:hypothetical protein [Arthrobacter sp. K5]|uniref:Uncharacterized protein n=1 Tax=Arthrobacter sp. K5 TaxID=2839623 RepID=A0AAU8EPX4_9MICC
MDPIKSLISGSDPLRNDPAEMPDADAALRRVTSGAPMFTDSLPANVLRFRDRKRRQARVAGVLTLAAATVTAGVLVATNFGALISAPAPAGPVAPTSSETTAAASAKPTATLKPTAARTVAPAATATAAPTPAPVTWTTFTDATGQATFEHPVGWTVSQMPQTIDGGSYNIVEVKTAAGKTVSTWAWSTTSRVARCARPRSRTRPSTPWLSTFRRKPPSSGTPSGSLRFVFRVIQGDKVYGSLALADGDLAPQPTTCGLYNGILGPDNVPFAHFGDTVWLTSDGQGAPLTFDSVVEAKAYPWRRKNTGTSSAC